MAAGLSLLACGDPAGPSRPASLAIVSGADQQGVVGDTLSAALEVRVVDARDRPVPSVLVRWAVTRGGGTLAADSVRSDASGRARTRWVMGEGAGEQLATASAAGLSPVTFHAAALAGAPATLVHVAPATQTAQVGTGVSEPPAVRVADRFGNPVPGVPVSFSVTEGGGALSGALNGTGGDGIARVGAWVLGTAAGPNTVVAAVEGRPALGSPSFHASGTAGPAASLTAHAGNDQRAAVQTPVTTPPTVRVVDAFDNPVPGISVRFEVTEGGGSVSESATNSDADGLAGAGAWTLGAEAGPNALRASSPDVGSVEFRAEAIASTVNFAVRGVHLNQGTQTADGAIDAIEGRPGLLRVTLDSNETREIGPSVRVRLYHGTTLAREAVIPPPTQGIGTDPDLSDPGHTWNLPLASSDVVPGLAVSVTIDPDGEIPEVDETDNDFPSGGGASAIEVRSLAPFRLILLPIAATAHGTIGRVDGGSVDGLLASTRRMIPVAEVEPTIRVPFSTGHDLSTLAGWSALLSDVQALRVAEGAGDGYYHGIIGAFSGVALGGLAYLPGSPASSFRSALSLENPDIIAHELGHNLGRPHAPCGGPANPDPSYPHPDATLGSPGYDILSGDLVAGPFYRDYMSYCDPVWTSDYTFGRVLDWRTDDPLSAGPGVVAARATPTRGLLLWGRIGPGGPHLNPALELDAVPAPPGRGGSDVLRGVGRDGAEVFRVATESVPVVDGDPRERHFAAFVPLAATAIASLSRIELQTPEGVAERGVAPSAGGGPDPGAPAVRLSPSGPGVLRVEWDAGRHPLLAVRDDATGAILAFARGGDVRIARAGSDGAGLVFDLSNGVSTRRARPR